MQIPYGRQNISDDDIESVVSVLRSDFLTQGPVVANFEEAVSSYTGAAFAIGSNSGTSGLHLACLALGIGPGDILWTAATTFVASANCGRYCGATVDFIDIDPHTYNLSVDALKSKLQQAKDNGTLPTVVIPVHLCGQSCDMESIWELGQEYGFKIIEDASHALGGRYKSLPVGNCKYSDITVFSFHPVKIITSGEGGMNTTNSPELAERMRRFRTHGITTSKELMHPRDTKELWNYQQIELGFNYRMNDIEAALGLSQMSRLDNFVSARHSIAQRYNSELSNEFFVLPHQHPDTYSSFHLYPIRLRLDQAVEHKRAYQDLREAGILVNLHYIPVYRHPYYEKLGFKKGYCSEAENYYHSALSIPIFPDLTEDEQSYTIERLNALTP